MSKIYTISLDPASRKFGVSLWHGVDYIASTCLESNLKDWSSRATEMRFQLKAFISRYVASTDLVTRAIIELIPKVADPSIQMCAGAVLADPVYRINPSRKFFVSPSSWKAYARRNGCPDKDPKGVPALDSIGFNPGGKKITSDDVADSILIFLTWVEKNGITE